MKFYILIFLIVLTSRELQAQKCTDYVDMVYDRVTGDTTWRAPKASVQLFDKTHKNPLSIAWIKSHPERYSLIIHTTPKKCIDEAADIYLLFKDNTRLTLYNFYKFGCDGSAVVYFGGQTDDLKVLKEKQILVIRILTSDGFIERELTDKQSKNFVDALRCLTQASKN